MKIHGANMVLRLQKANVIENDSLSILQKFINTVMHPVLGDYVSKVCVVTLNNDQMEKIKKAIALERPKKFCLDNNLQSAGVLMKDQGVLPNTCSGQTLYTIVTIFWSCNKNKGDFHCCLKSDLATKTTTMVHTAVKCVRNQILLFVPALIL